MDSLPLRAALWPVTLAFMASNFWDRLQQAFAERGYETSQSGIARELGCGQSAVAKWAKGTGYPSMRRVVFAAKLLGVSANWLLTGQGNKNEQGDDMDPLTDRLLEQWAQLPAEVRREVLQYLQFRAAQARDGQERPPAARAGKGPGH